jgi:hypothetical protein
MSTSKMTPLLHPLLPKLIPPPVTKKLELGVATAIVADKELHVDRLPCHNIAPTNE